MIDHCAIYFLIAGTYTPIALGPLRAVHPLAAWLLFGFIWAACALGVTLTAIDLKKYHVFSMVCYIAMGWCVVVLIRYLLDAMPLAALWWLLGGGVAYTVGSVLYGLGGKHRYMHSIFHLFVLLGSALHFVCIFVFIMNKSM
ncbi:hypothetical protein FACS1894196_5070 [Clostridia bacterium]|nr:hypothetical protein FACS1894196_5070 [Clostridia bacterium]